MTGKETKIELKKILAHLKELEDAAGEVYDWPASNAYQDAIDLIEELLAGKKF